MASVQFYHLTATPLDRALPKLLEKAVATGHRVLLVERENEVRQHLNQILWTYSTLSFLPHGTPEEAKPERQPVLLSPKQENLNNADILLITDGSLADGSEKITRVIDLFDGNNPESVASARTRWKQYKDAGHELTYLRQTEEGGWQQNAAA